jgi:hypothetical protein
MIEAYRKYTQNGFTCLPTKADKCPQEQETWKNGFSEEYFKEAFGIGIVCGEKSGGLECFDFDNHFGDAKKVLSDYLSIPEIREIYQKHKLPIESTMSGGFHLLFRCTKNEGNRKLAKRQNIETKEVFAIIETRGEGGYFVASPTPGYTVVRNDIYSIAVILESERQTMIDVAVSMNEFFQSVKVVNTEYEGSERPGDVYNKKSNAIDEMKSILVSAGWTEVTKKMWRRPGKDNGVSASMGVIAPNVFYVFTSSAYPLEENKCYTPFQILAIYRFNSDFTATAASLVEKKPLVAKSDSKLEISEIEQILLKSKIDTTREVKEPPIILSVVERGIGKLNYRRMFTLGNFSAIIGKAKTKKTFLLTLLTSAILSDCSQKFLSQMHHTGKKELLWFDTEQGEYDAYNAIKRIERLSGNVSALRAFNLRPYSPHDRCKIIERAFELWGNNVGFCVIDGIADLANGINDEDEATRVTTILLRLTKIYNCHISIVIHQNKNDNFATGHLGSALMKKAEIIISVAKNSFDKSVADVSCDLSRGIDFESFSFKINEGLPEVCEAITQPVKSYFNEKEESEQQVAFPDEKEEIPF